MTLATGPWMTMGQVSKLENQVLPVLYIEAPKLIKASMLQDDLLRSPVTDLYHPTAKTIGSVFFTRCIN